MYLCISKAAVTYSTCYLVVVVVMLRTMDDLHQHRLTGGDHDRDEGVAMAAPSQPHPLLRLPHHHTDRDAGQLARLLAEPHSNANGTVAVLVIVSALFCFIWYVCFFKCFRAFGMCAPNGPTSKCSDTRFLSGDFFFTIPPHRDSSGHRSCYDVVFVEEDEAVCRRMRTFMIWPDLKPKHVP